VKVHKDQYLKMEN